MNSRADTELVHLARLVEGCSLGTAWRRSSRSTARCRRINFGLVVFLATPDNELVHQGLARKAEFVLVILEAGRFEEGLGSKFYTEVGAEAEAVTVASQVQFMVRAG